MSLPFEPAQLYATADRTERLADVVRECARRLAAGATAARWYSPGARRFRAEVDGLAARMRLAAGRIDAAAEALRRHARQVELQVSEAARARALAAAGVDAAVDSARSGR